MADFTVVWWDEQRGHLMTEIANVDTAEEAPNDAGMPHGLDFMVFAGAPEIVFDSPVKQRPSGPVLLTKECSECHSGPGHCHRMDCSVGREQLRISTVKLRD